MPDYSKGKIYRLVSDDSDLVYYGSTTQELSQYLASTKRQYKLWKDGKKERFKTASKLFDEVGVDNVKIIWVEDYPSKSRKELESRERYYIEEAKKKLQIACVNKVIPGRTQKEWNYANKNKIKERKKEYHQKNKEKRNEKTKERYRNNKDMILENSKKYREANKNMLNEQKKKYHQKNKEKINEKKKIYYEKNKEEINKKRKQTREANKEILCEKEKECRDKSKERIKAPFTCICGSICRTDGKSGHFKSQKHQNFIKNNSEN